MVEQTCRLGNGVFVISGWWTMLRVIVMCVLIVVGSGGAGAGEITFEDLQDGPLAGQGAWKDYDAEPSLLALKTVTPAHSGQLTRVLASAAGNDFVSLRGEATLGIGQDARIIQVDVCPGRSVIVEISVGHDLDVMPAKGGGDARRGPSLGFSGAKFIVRPANPNNMLSADLAATDGRDDWYRLQLVIDFAANGGSGAGTLQVRNLTDDEKSFRTVLSGVDLQMKARMSPVSRDPAKWNAWLVRVNGAGAMVDNLSVVTPPQPEP
jgi:hypothetical protein